MEQESELEALEIETIGEEEGCLNHKVRTFIQPKNKRWTISNVSVLLNESSDLESPSEI